MTYVIVVMSLCVLGVFGAKLINRLKRAKYTQNA